VQLWVEALVVQKANSQKTIMAVVAVAVAAAAASAAQVKN